MIRGAGPNQGDEPADDGPTKKQVQQQNAGKVGFISSENRRQEIKEGGEQKESHLALLPLRIRRRTSDCSLGALHLHQKFREFPLPFFLVLAGFRLGKLSDVHGTKFGSAHRTEFRFLVEIVGKRFVVHGASGLGIERKLELLVPIEQKTRVAERVVAVACSRAVTR